MVGSKAHNKEREENGITKITHPPSFILEQVDRKEGGSTLT